MKINTDQIFDSHGALANGLSGVLLFGPEQGLISETITKCVAAVAGVPANPFMVSELTSTQILADPPRLSDELYALPMMGERKIIVVRAATDSIASTLEAVFADLPTPNFLLVESGDLPARSKLRKIFGNEKYVGAAGCYEDNNNILNALISEIIDARRIQIEQDARTELIARIGNDRMVSRSELEKLALYVGDVGKIRFSDVINIIGDSSAFSLERVVYFAVDGKTRLADQSLARALANGISPVQVLRALQSHFQRLHMVSEELRCGTPMDKAVDQLRPPIFFKLKSRFQQQCRNWSSGQLKKAMGLALRAEYQCKQTGAPMAAICQRTVLRLAAAAQKQIHRQS